MSQTALTQTAHFLLRKKTSGVAFLFFDSPGKQNFLTHAVIAELEQTIKQIESDAAIAAVVLISGKGDSFVAGADLHEILKYQTTADAEKLSRYGNKVFSDLANLTKPTVAAINGLCVGGGLELALCCERRVATDAPITVLGLPEVSHGLIPGLGGTQRLPRLIGAGAAIEVILNSDLYDSNRALELGIVDEVVSPDELLKRAEALALAMVPQSLQDQNPTTSQRKHQASQRKREATQPEPEQLKKLFALWKRSVRLKTKGRYPAKAVVLDVIEKGLNQGFDAGIEFEISTFAKLAVSDVARNLIFLFFTKELAKQQAFKEARKTGQIFEDKSDLILFDDANVFADSHANVSAELLQNLLKAANDLPENAALGVVISTFLINELVASIPDNENIIGMQFFQPIDQIKIVEVIPHQNTSQVTKSIAVRNILKSKKLPIVVSDSPGFLVNRIVCTYLQQAERLATSGVPVSWLEQAATAFGLPIGPFAMLDEIGLQNAAAIMRCLHFKLSDRFSISNTIFKALECNLSGRKTSYGTYLWQDGSRENLNPALEEKLGLKIHGDPLLPDQAIALAQKLILPMVDEAARCLEEKIVRRPREIDLCLVLSIGFPAFRGGLLKYADSLGINNLIAEINEIYQETAPTRRISDYLMNLQRDKRGFYSRAMD